MEGENPRNVEGENPFYTVPWQVPLEYITHTVIKLRERVAKGPPHRGVNPYTWTCVHTKEDRGKRKKKGKKP